MAKISIDGLFDEEDAREIIREMGKEGNVESFIVETYTGKGKKLHLILKQKKLLLKVLDLC